MRLGMLRGETWQSWATGLAFGAFAGLVVLLGGAPLSVPVVGLLALALVAVRTLGFVSGALIGFGGLWIALTIRAQLACDAFDAAPNQGCQGFGVGGFLMISGIVFGIGLLMGVVAWRRRAGQRSRSTP
jgi:hypothetical protein